MVFEKATFLMQQIQTLCPFSRAKVGRFETPVTIVLDTNAGTFRNSYEFAGGSLSLVHVQKRPLGLRLRFGVLRLFCNYAHSNV